MHKWEGQRKRVRESKADSVLSVEPDMGLDPPTLKLGPEPKSRVQHFTG